MNAYLWHTGRTLAHHIKAQSLDEVRERIAVTHGDDVARSAVIKPIVERSESKPAA